MSNTNNYNKILSNIKNLQNAQKTLHTKLNMLPPNENFEKQKLLISQIDKINNQKVELFEELYALQILMQDNVDLKTDDLQTKIYLTKLAEEQLNRDQERIKHTRNKNINNLRMTEINNYYTGNYSLYLKIFKYVIYTAIIIIAIAVLRQRYIINSVIANILAMIVLAFGGFFVLTSSLDLSSRNNLVINEYDFQVESQDNGNGGSHDLNPPKSTWMDEMERYKKDLELLAQGECLGPACCQGDGMVFDDKKMICKLDPGKKGKSEGFTNGGRLQPANLCDDNRITILDNPGGKYYASS